jgi:cell division protein FtsN
MSREYGRKRPMRRSHAGSRQFLLVLLAFLIGYLTASMFDFASLSHWVNAQWLGQQNPTIKLATEVSPEHKPPLPKPKFEFYTLLANGRSAQPVQKQEPQKTTDSEKVKPEVITQTTEKPASNTKETYGIQVASFKTHPEAERMKAQLILKGFTTTILTLSQPQGNWYRVIIGPFPNKTEAQRVQSEFARSEHVVGMIRKLEG